MASVGMDAVEIVYWYETQPEGATFKTDGEIAVSLGWFKGGRQLQPVTEWHERKRQGPDGDIARVRKARRYVDRNNSAGQVFYGYSFGTYPNGRGSYIKMIMSPRIDPASDQFNLAAGTQIFRIVQMANQGAAERARQIGQLEALEERYRLASMDAQRIHIHDMAIELRDKHRLDMATLQKAYQLGILDDLKVGV